MPTGKAFPKLYGGVDYGVPLPSRNSSVWLYAHAGIAWRPARAARSRLIYFGSFRNNYVDDRPEKRYREMESFPGFEIDEIAARRFAKLTGEVNLPPIRFAEVGTPAFYLSYIRPAVFAGVMATSSARRQQPSLHAMSAPSSTSTSPSRCGCRWCSRSAPPAGLARRPLSQDRMARLAEDHVV